MLLVCHCNLPLSSLVELTVISYASYQPQNPPVKPPDESHRTEIPRAEMTENAPEIKKMEV
jgi:hypothetical protein